MKRLCSLSAMVLLLAWSAAGQSGAQSQTSAGASSSTNVSAGKGGVQAQNDSSISASQQANSKTKNSKTETDAGANSSTSASMGTGEPGLAAGSTLNAVLTKSIDSRKAKEGDEVTAKTTSETKAEGQRPIPKGTKLIGHVTKADARAKGDSESALGILFDRAEVGKGREIPIHAVVQALAVERTSAAMSDDSMGGMPAPPPSGGSAANSGGGGLVGGAVNNAGNTVARTTGSVDNTAGQAAGTAVGTANSTVGRTTAGVGGAANASLQAASQGVIGLPGYTLDASAANATQGSVISSSGKNVKLDSGTQMVLRVVSQ